MPRLCKRQIESEDAVSHRLMHLKPAGEAADSTFASPRDAASYTSAHSELGSPHLKELVYCAMEVQDFSRIDVLLTHGPTSPVDAALRRRL